jgi:hypothetical protein
MLIDLNTTFTNTEGLTTYSDHPFLDDPTGLEGLFLPHNPKSYSLPGNPTTSSNLLKNLGSAASNFYLGSAPVNGVADISKAPSFDNGKLFFRLSESDRLIQSGGPNSDFSISNQAKLIILWVKPNFAGTASVMQRHTGSADSNYILYMGADFLQMGWIWAGDTNYTFNPVTCSLDLTQLHQIAWSFEPNGANSTLKTFLDGAQVGQTDYTGKNAFKYSAATPSTIVGFGNAGDSFQGSIYEIAIKNLSVSGSNAASDVALDYKEMAGFYAGL